MLQAYNSILTAVKDLCPTAHIGGGAVRDTLLERPIKDIDLFLDDAATDEAPKLLRSKFGYVKVGEWTQYEKFSDPVVARLAKFEKWHSDQPDRSERAAAHSV
jgi:tRNA nucleotidyltransferase/poly(A) polymerase